jgi:hypothetical protein
MQGCSKTETNILVVSLNLIRAAFHYQHRNSSPPTLTLTDYYSQLLEEQVRNKRIADTLIEWLIPVFHQFEPP